MVWIIKLTYKPFSGKLLIMTLMDHDWILSAKDNFLGTMLDYGFESIRKIYGKNTHVVYWNAFILYDEHEYLLNFK